MGAQEGAEILFLGNYGIIDVPVLTKKNKEEKRMKRNIIEAIALNRKMKYDNRSIMTRNKEW